MIYYVEKVWYRVYHGFRLKLVKSNARILFSCHFWHNTPSTCMTWNYHEPKSKFGLSKSLKHTVEYEPWYTLYKEMKSFPPSLLTSSEASASVSQFRTNGKITFWNLYEEITSNGTTSNWITSNRITINQNNFELINMRWK